MSKNRKIKSSSTTGPMRARAGSGDGPGGEVVGILALGASVFVLAALVSFQANGLLMGPFGRAIANLVYGTAGIPAYALVALVALVVAVVIATPLRMRQVLGWIWDGLRATGATIAAGATAAARFVGDVFGAILPERDRDDYEPEEAPSEDAMAIEPSEQEAE